MCLETLLLMPTQLKIADVNGQYLKFYYFEAKKLVLLPEEVFCYSTTEFANITRIDGVVYKVYDESTGIITWYYGNEGV